MLLRVAINNAFPSRLREISNRIFDKHPTFILPETNCFDTNLDSVDSRMIIAYCTDVGKVIGRLAFVHFRRAI